MAVKFNLLPKEESINNSFDRFQRMASSLSVIGAFVLIIAILGMAGFYIFERMSLTRLNTELDALSSQIRAQQESEQKIVLLKDRIGKIEMALKTDDAVYNLTEVNRFLANAGPDAVVNQLNVDPKQIKMGIGILSNAALSKFMRDISTWESFDIVTQESLNFGPASGYAASFVIDEKQNVPSTPVVEE